MFNRDTLIAAFTAGLKAEETAEQLAERVLELVSSVEAKAVSHPLRARILVMFGEEDELSPVVLSQRLNAPLGNVSYHVRWLNERGLIIATRQAQRRGANEHYYSLVR